MRKYFLLLFSAVLLLLTGYMALRIGSELWQKIALLALAILLFLFPLRISRREDGRLSLLAPLTYLALGYFSWLFVLTLTRDALLFLIWVLGIALPLSGSLVFLGAALFTLLGFVWAARGLRARAIQIDGFPEDFRLAQISDLHMGATLGVSYVKRVVDLAAQHQPHATVLTGDILDGDIRALRHELQELSRLPGKLFFVPGNHEYYWGFPAWAGELERLGFTVLLNQGERLEGRPVWIGGVPDTILQGRPGAPDAQAALQGARETDYRILLSHRPEMAASAEKAGFHLQLSGHTHGGQFFPWTIVARFFHEHFLGLMQRGKLWIYVSPGTGTWGPPLRLGTTPEVTFFERA